MIKVEIHWYKNNEDSWIYQVAQITEEHIKSGYALPDRMGELNLNKERIKANDWIVWKGEGYHTIYSNEMFNKLFTVNEPGDEWDKMIKERRTQCQ